MKEAVIIGAGQTGRGFIAPIVEKNGYHITFLDKDSQLIENLKKEKEYYISYFGNCKPSKKMTNFDAYQIEEPESIKLLATADIIFVSIFASHITELTKYIQEAVQEKVDEKMKIICCENGVNVKKPLVDAGIDAVISEGIIFCTTLRPDDKSLNLITQDYPVLPIDGKVSGLDVQLEGMPLEQDFGALIQRKIYTYNFISAVVTYLGAYQGYEVYGEAANDSRICGIIDKLVPIVSRVIAKKYGISYEEQLHFTKKAVEKFQNKEIYDTIYRNARQAERKLDVQERLIVPLRLACEYGEDTSCMELAVAAAIYYGEKEESMNAEHVIDNLSDTLSDSSPVERIKEMVAKMRDKGELEQMMR